MSFLVEANIGGSSGGADGITAEDETALLQCDASGPTAVYLLGAAGNRKERPSSSKKYGIMYGNMPCQESDQPLEYAVLFSKSEALVFL